MGLGNPTPTKNRARVHNSQLFGVTKCQQNLDVLFVDEHSAGGGEVARREGAEVDAGGDGFAMLIASVPIGGAVPALI